jgi:uncharacterized SAM-dependent methyltransferase
VKDVTRLEAAYNDAAGVTAEFNKNVLRVLNRELAADFDVEQFDHLAAFDSDEEWIEMRLRSERLQDVTVRALGLRVRFEGGETMRTEISAKFRPERIEDELAAAGLSIAEMWPDAGRDFSLVLAQR